MTFWRTRTAPWAIFGATLVSLLAIGWILAATNPPTGQCEGLGFGCELTGWDLVVFVGWIVALPYVVILAVLLALASLLPDRLAGVRTGVAALGLALPWAAVAFLLTPR